MIVARSKLVLDFSLTITFLHLVVVSLYEHELPRGVLWWAMQFLVAGIMIGGGTWACQWRELRPMSFGLGGDGGSSAGGGSGGSYEMVPVDVEDGSGGAASKHNG